jgi:hypothetical protein
VAPEKERKAVNGWLAMLFRSESNTSIDTALEIADAQIWSIDSQI